MKRLLALLGAVLLVALAVFVRDRLDDDGTTSTGGGSSDDAAVLVCVTELEVPCRELGMAHDDITVRIEDAAVTETALVTGSVDTAEPTFDAWLTLAPFPEMVAEQRSRALQTPALDEVSSSLARSPLVIVVWNERRDALAGFCSGALTWRCIGEAGGRPWGELGGQSAWGFVKPSHPLPDRTAAGLLVLSQASGSYLERTDFSRNDFDANPSFRRWFEQLERSIPSFPASPRTPLDEMLSIGPAVFDLTGSPEAAAGPSVSGSRDKDRLTILYPSPATVADVVVAPVANADQGGRVTELLESSEMAELLARSGWRVDGEPLADGLDGSYVLPSDSGRPRPGVLEALRSLWVETIR